MKGRDKENVEGQWEKGGGGGNERGVGGGRMGRGRRRKSTIRKAGVKGKGKYK